MLVIKKIIHGVSPDQTGIPSFRLQFFIGFIAPEGFYGPPIRQRPAHDHGQASANAKQHKHSLIFLHFDFLFSNRQQAR
jgi:hypothetical protein